MARTNGFTAGLQNGVKLIACADILLSLVSIMASTVEIGYVFYGSPLVTVEFSLEVDNNQLSDYDRAVILAIMPPIAAGVLTLLIEKVLVLAAGMFFSGIIQLILAATLFSGANQRNRGRCIVWLIVTTVFAVVNGIICCRAFTIDDDWLRKIVLLFNLVYTISEIVWVGYFLEELKSSKCIKEDVENMGSTGKQS